MNDMDGDAAHLSNSFEVLDDRFTLYIYMDRVVGVMVWALGLCV